VKRLVLGLCVGLVACGDELPAQLPPGAHDVETWPVERPLSEQWPGVCVARFTRPFTNYDSLSDTVLNADAGDELLLRELWSSEEFQLLLPAQNGVLAHHVTLDQPSSPFETDCGIDRTASRVAVFRDVTLYADPELRQPICQLARGTSFPVDRWSAGDDEDGAKVIDILGWPFPCDGHARAFVALEDSAWPIEHVAVPRR
jgi:hypothetical protein